MRKIDIHPRLARILSEFPFLWAIKSWWGNYGERIDIDTPNLPDFELALRKWWQRRKDKDPIQLWAVVFNKFCRTISIGEVGRLGDERLLEIQRWERAHNDGTYARLTGGGTIENHGPIEHILIAIRTDDQILFLVYFVPPDEGKTRHSGTVLSYTGIMRPPKKLGDFRLILEDPSFKEFAKPVDTQPYGPIKVALGSAVGMGYLFLPEE